MIPPDATYLDGYNEDGFPASEARYLLSKMMFERSLWFTGRGALPWILVLGAMSLDIATTALGLSIGLVELNPVAAIGLESIGVAALAALKAPALAIGLLGWWTLPDRYRQLNLLGLAMPWAGAGATNGWLILASL